MHENFNTLSPGRVYGCCTLKNFLSRLPKCQYLIKGTDNFFLAVYNIHQTALISWKVLMKIIALDTVFGRQYFSIGFSTISSILIYKLWKDLIIIKFFIFIWEHRCLIFCHDFISILKNVDGHKKMIVKVGKCCSILKCLLLSTRS